MTFVRFLVVSLATIVHTAVLAAPVDSLQGAQQLFKQGQYAGALEKVDSYLSSHPKEIQARFLRGLALTELNRTQEAIGVFTALTQDYPDLPEPYNNLAVLYAAQGQYDKAKNSLEMAIRTHPSYATAHENLGDIYAKMASQAYDKALQLDKGNLSAQTKLSLIKDLFSPAQRSEMPAKTNSAMADKGTPTKVATPINTLAPPAIEPTKQNTVVVGTTEAPTPSTGKPASKPISLGKLPADPKQAAERVLQAWADAWSRRDADGYLSFYADNFKVPGKKSHEAWAAERRIRVTQPEYIKVELSRLSYKVKGNQVTVTFRQDYESNILKSLSTKRITLAKQGGTWKILEER